MSDAPDTLIGWDDSDASPRMHAVYEVAEVERLRAIPETMIAKLEASRAEATADGWLDSLEYAITQFEWAKSLSNK